MAAWIGLDKALARMLRLPVEINVAVDKQLEEEAQELAAAIRRAVPVRTGALRDTIKVVPGDRPLSRRIVAGGQETTVKIRARVKAADFAKAKAAGNNKGEYDYFRAVEFGHLSEDGVPVPAEPFFFTTYRARKKAMRRRIAGAARKQLKNLFPE
jgi:hypothetical protein